MIKLSLSFLAGTVFATVAVILAGGRASAYVALGFLLAVSIASGVLWLVGARRFARFLEAFMDAVEHTRTTRPAAVPRPIRHTAEATGYRKPSSKQQRQILEDTIAEYAGDDFFVQPGKVA